MSVFASLFLSPSENASFRRSGPGSHSTRIAEWMQDSMTPGINLCSSHLAGDAELRKQWALLARPPLGLQAWVLGKNFRFLEMSQEALEGTNSGSLQKRRPLPGGGRLLHSDQESLGVAGTRLVKATQPGQQPVGEQRVTPP